MRPNWLRNASHPDLCIWTQIYTYKCLKVYRLFIKAIFAEHQLPRVILAYLQIKYTASVFKQLLSWYSNTLDLNWNTGLIIWVPNFSSKLKMFTSILSKQYGNWRSATVTLSFSKCGGYVKKKENMLPTLFNDVNTLKAVTQLLNLEQSFILNLMCWSTEEPKMKKNVSLSRNCTAVSEADLNATVLAWLQSVPWDFNGTGAIL